MKKTVIYKYNVELYFILNNTSYDLKSSSIGNIIIDYDYFNKNMPIIFCSMNIDLAMFKTIKENEDNGRFLLIIKRNEDNSPLKSTYIKGQFKYFIPTNRNEWNTEFVNKSGDETTGNIAYKSTVVGLMSEDMINNNSKIYNGIYTNTTSASIVHKATNHFKKMVIESFNYNYNIKNEFIIPPIESVSELLSFIDTYYPFYDTPYMYFIDFDQAYLMSSNGNFIDKKDNDYKVVNIDIINSINTDDGEGMIINTDNKSYYLNTFLGNSILKVNIYLDSIVNTINTIDIDGNISEEILDLLNDGNITKKYKFQRVNNIDSSLQLKNNIEDSIVKLTISKNNIDTKIITPNKIYIVNNFEDNKKYNGKYILTKKHEIFTSQENGSFELVTGMEFKMVKNR